jgi:hypothetical protein
MLTFVKTGDSLLMSFMKFSHMFRVVLYEIVTVQLQQRNICARWVPRILTDKHKQKCMGAALSFLECYHREGDEFLDHIVTGDETWVSHYTPEGKRQSQEWHHAHTTLKRL